MFRLQFQFQLELPFPLSALHFRAALRSRHDSHGIRPQLAQLCSVQFSVLAATHPTPLRHSFCFSFSFGCEWQRGANESDDLRTALRAASRSRTAVEFETLVENQNQNKKLEKRKVELENGRQNAENRKQRMINRIGNYEDNATRLLYCRVQVAAADVAEPIKCCCQRCK